MRKKKGNLFIVSAPSGAGKTTLCQKLCEVMPGIKHSVSYTTRKPRPGEVNDRDYTFIEEQKFKKMAGDGEFAEWAEVHGNFYGTSRQRLGDMLTSGIDVILDVDTQGAVQLREVYPEGIFIFIMPPSIATLKERLQGRMADTPEEIKQRITRASGEIKDYLKYNYVIVNSIFEEALRDLEAIVISSGLGVEKIDPAWVEKNFLR